MESEIISSIPQSYKKGRTKFIVVTGSVISGVGKGTFTSSLATLFQFYKLRVSMLKFDGYLNVDAGTLNPYRHGEVFVLDDGTEGDLDLGSYERALHRNICKENYLTGGKIFKMVIEKERKGEYLGRDVQFIPHVTGEINRFIRQMVMKDNSDIAIIEVGGTVGDIENSYFIEAMRELQYEEGRENVIFVNVAYIIEPNSLGEQKSKAAQLGVSRLMSLGVQPNLIVLRCHNPVSQGVKERISMVANVPIQNVISAHDLDTIYKVPTFLAEQKVSENILKIFNLKPDKNRDFFRKWNIFVSRLKSPEKEIEIAITGKYTGVHDSYLSILRALEHCEAFLKCKVKIRWIETTEINTLKQAEKALKGVTGIIVPGGFGSRGTEGKIACIQYARENNIPFLGLCYGLQLATIEFSRNACGLKGANSTEIEPNTPEPVIDILPEQKAIINKGGTMRLGGHNVLVKKSTLANKLYKKEEIRERFRHRYEVNPLYIKKLEHCGLVFSGISKEDSRIMQILELPEHNFFMASQFHPELLSWPLKPHPMFVGFVKACLN